MLARTVLHSATQQSCCASAAFKASQIQHGRVLVVAKASSSSRSASPRTDSWRVSWRTELEHGSNGNGAHTQHHDDSAYTAYRTASNGNGYHANASHPGTQDSVTTWQGRWGVDTDTETAVSSPSPADGYTTDPSSSASHPADDVSSSSSGGSFFTDAFKEALKAALERSPLYADEFGDGAGSGGEETVEPQPYESEIETMDRPIFTNQFRQVLKESLARQQAEADREPYGSDDEYIARPYVPAPPPRREMSPIEEVLATALGASQLHLRRLNLMKNEIGAAIERETKQIERLEFALSKAQSDAAYYKSLEELASKSHRPE